MAENERKNEIIGANYAWNIRSPVNLCKPWLNLGATSGSGVTVICVSPCYVYPHTHSLRSCPLPIIPLCLSREEGVIFFLSQAEETEKQKKKTADLRLPYTYP